MVPLPLSECTFLIPVRRDAELSDGDPHDAEAWEWLTDELYDSFNGVTTAPGLYQGVWKSSKTGQRVADESRKFIVALASDKVDYLRHILAEACDVFKQQAIYLSVGGQVEFIEALRHDPP
jgi:hypothetical protein